MDIIRFSIRNPVKVAVGVILTVLFGMIALTHIPIQLTPDVDRPVITVRTTWPGRSPEEIEKSILIEQEEKLKTVQGLWKMVSSADLGRGFITLEFNVGVDVSRALQEVANTLDEVPYYPDEVDRPVIRASDSASDDSVANCLLQAEDPDYEIAEFYDFADRFMKPALERIPGVAEIGIYGGRAPGAGPLRPGRPGPARDQRRRAAFRLAGGQHQRIGRRPGQRAAGRAVPHPRPVRFARTAPPHDRGLRRWRCADPRGGHRRGLPDARKEGLFRPVQGADHDDGVRQAGGRSQRAGADGRRPRRSTNSTRRAGCCGPTRTTVMESACGWSSTTPITSAARWTW